MSHLDSASQNQTGPSSIRRPYRTMDRSSLLGLLLTGLLLCVLSLPNAWAAPPPPDSTVIGTDTTHLGVSWTPPSDTGPALRQLRQIHGAGANSLRLPAPSLTPELLTRADTLGLALFADLPVSYVSAPALDDSLQNVNADLSRLQRLAQRHPSLRYVGLAHGANTTAARACTTLSEWTRRIHKQSSLQTYYTTPFAVSVDRCNEAVDLTLVDVRGRPGAPEYWPEWTDSTQDVGFGAVGTWIDPDAAEGLRAPHSPERQARYLERVLTTLVDSLPSEPPVFVHRWQDRTPSLLSSRRYGLHTSSGASRPAAAVVEGIYTGAQRVFAFPNGSGRSTSPHGFVLLGWILIALLGGLYAQNPFARETAVRYFAGHGFYRDAVAKGRDINPIVNTTLLVTVAIAVGMIAALSARIIVAQPSTTFFLEALPPFLRSLLGRGLVHPSLTGLVAGAATIALLTAWMGALMLAVYPKTPVSLAQGLMLVVWPCWPALGGMLLALVAATVPPFSPGVLGLLLVGGSVVALLSVTARVVRDVWAVTDVSVGRAALLVLPSPPVVLGVALFSALKAYDLPVSLLWALAAHA